MFYQLRHTHLCSHPFDVLEAPFIILEIMSNLDIFMLVLLYLNHSITNPHMYVNKMFAYEL